MSRRRQPQQFFSASFLDVVTASGGVFLMLVLIFVAATVMNTRLELRDRIDVLWTEATVLRSQAEELETLLYERRLRVQDARTELTAVERGATTATGNVRAASERRRIQTLRSRVGTLGDSVTSLRGTVAAIQQELRDLGSVRPQAELLRLLRPATEPHVDDPAWSLLLTVWFDSVLSIAWMGDTTSYAWPDSLNEGDASEAVPIRSRGHPIRTVLQPGGLLEEWARSQGDNDAIVAVTLHPNAVESYPVLRDALLGHNLGISLKFRSAPFPQNLVFTSEGWNPKRIHD